MKLGTFLAIIILLAAGVVLIVEGGVVKPIIGACMLLGVAALSQSSDIVRRFFDGKGSAILFIITMSCVAGELIWSLKLMTTASDAGEVVFGVVMFAIVSCALTSYIINGRLERRYVKSR